MSDTLQIGFLGAGAMTRALAPAWVAAGHDVVVGGRDAERCRDTAVLVGARPASLLEAADHAGVAVLAVRWEGVRWTLDQVGEALAGKVLVDVTNPVEVERFGVVTPPQTSVAEQAETQTGARVAKAFNLAQASVWAEPRTIDGARLAVPVATDDPGARDVVNGLAAALGFATLDAGELRHARHLEAMAAIVIRRLFAGDPPTSTFAWVS